MIENSFEIQSAIRQGLPRESTPTVNIPHMQVMQNLIPRENCMSTPPAIARPGIFETGPKNFPFPMAFKGDSIRLLMEETDIRTLNSAFAQSSPLTLNARAGGTDTITRGTAWHCETFLDMFWATNGESLVYKLPSDDGDTYVDNALTVQAIGRHDYRVLLGGLSGDWLSGSQWATVFATWRETQHGQLFVHDGISATDTYVIWSESGGGATDIPFHSLSCALGLRGASEYDTTEEIIVDALERGEIGLQPIRKVSNIRQLKQLGSRVIVYGDNGISELRPFEGGFQEELIADFGVAGRTCVGGDSRRHVFVTNDGTLYSFFSNQDRPERQGYQQFFAPMYLSRLVVTHDPVEDFYWLTDGLTCYVLSRTGLGGPMTTHPSCLWRDGSQGLVGVYTTPVTWVWRIETSKWDMGERDFKHVAGLQIHGTGWNNAFCRLKGNYSVGGAEILTPWAQVTENGVVYSSMTFQEGSAEIYGYGLDVDFTTIEVRYQGEGKSHRRGTAGRPDGD